MPLYLIAHSAAGVSGCGGFYNLEIALCIVKVDDKRKRLAAAPAGARSLPDGERVASLVH